MSEPNPAAVVTSEPLTDPRALSEILELMRSQQAQIAALCGQLDRQEKFSELLFDQPRQRIIDQGRRPLCEHLAEYQAVMLSRGGVKHVTDAWRRVRVMVRLARAAYWRELTKSKIEVATVKLRASRPRRRTFGSTTLNHYLYSIKGFCNWMVDDVRAERSPCRGIRPAAKTDIRKVRRPLTHGELVRLFDAATRGKTIAGIPGTERALCYILATTTGLRSGEILSLTPEHFFLDSADGAAGGGAAGGGAAGGGNGPHVMVEARRTKNKKGARQNLRGDVAEMMRSFLAGKQPGVAVFHRPANGMHSLRKDLAAAGIEYRVNGKDADFHAQRHTFVSDLISTGATPRETQEAARHHDSRLTMEVYAHAAGDKLRAAIERLPALPPDRMNVWADAIATAREAPQAAGCTPPRFDWKEPSPGNSPDPQPLPENPLTENCLASAATTAEQRGCSRSTTTIDS